MKVYVASSWRNQNHQCALRAIGAVGYDVIDGADVVPLDAPLSDYELGLQEQVVAQRGADMSRADAIVVVEPSGRGAAIALGYALGAGKPACVLLCATSAMEPMYGLAAKTTATIDGVLVWLAVLAKKRAAERQQTHAAAAAPAAKPANFPVWSPAWVPLGWAQLSLVEKIASVLREGRRPDVHDSADYYERKAHVFDLIADEEAKTWEAMPDRTELGRKIAEARRMAQQARRRAGELRARREAVAS